jgi:hypothetical protein
MFTDGNKIGYLMLINVNTRKLFATLLNMEVAPTEGDDTLRLRKQIKESPLLIRGLENLLTQTPIKHLIMDGERGM